MRTKNLLKLATFMLAMILSVGAFAQAGVIANSGEYENADGATPANTSYVTVGKTIPLFVWPSTYYHPDYDPSDGSGLTANFTWTWATGDATTASLSGQDLNYVVVTGEAIGTTTVNAKEKAPAAWGGCEDATGTDITITVVDKPTYVLTGVGTTLEVCEGDGSIPAAGPVITFTGYVNFDYTYTLEIKTVDQNGNDANFYDIDKLNPEAAAKFAVEYTKASPATATATTDNLALPTGGYTLLDNKSTIYTYEVAFVNDVVSRKSDFLANAAKTKANFEYYDINKALDGAARSTYSIVINPTPVTGPIYHIPNTWSN